MHDLKDKKEQKQRFKEKTGITDDKIEVFNSFVFNNNRMFTCKRPDIRLFDCKPIASQGYYFFSRQFHSTSRNWSAKI
jgi:hypothetical protein